MLEFPPKSEFIHRCRARAAGDIPAAAKEAAAVAEGAFDHFGTRDTRGTKAGLVVNVLP